LLELYDSLISSENGKKRLKLKHQILHPCSDNESDEELDKEAPHELMLPEEDLEEDPDEGLLSDEDPDVEEGETVFLTPESQIGYLNTRLKFPSLSEDELKIK